MKNIPMVGRSRTRSWQWLSRAGGFNLKKRNCEFLIMWSPSQWNSMSSCVHCNLKLWSSPFRSAKVGGWESLPWLLQRRWPQVAWPSSAPDHRPKIQTKSVITKTHSLSTYPGLAPLLFWNHPIPSPPPYQELTFESSRVAIDSQSNAAIVNVCISNRNICSH